MNQATREQNITLEEEKLYMAMELSQKKWLLNFGNGLKTRRITIAGGDVEGLKEAIKKAREKFKLREQTKVYSCYEAGRDGFWIHRCLSELGLINYVIDPSSIEVDRRARRAKTDKLDVEKLLKLLKRHVDGEEQMRVVRVPGEEEEDNRRLHRERERLKKERTGHTNRIKSLLNLCGHKFKGKGRKSWEEYIKGVRDWRAELLLGKLRTELIREAQRLEMVEKQLKELELEREVILETENQPQINQVRMLMNLKGIGECSAWILMMEWLSWRTFKNRREVGAAAGLVGSPYDSGDSRREQGITKAGNRRIRGLMLELAWSWVRYQPQSELAQWFERRFSQSKRSRKVGIVALARRLLIALWRYVTRGEIPAGAQLKMAV